MPDVESTTACHDFLEHSMKRVERLARSELRRTGCTDWNAHAEDVLGEVSAKILEKWDTLRSPEDALNTITVNTARTHASKCRRESPQEIDESAETYLHAGPIDSPALWDAVIYVEELLSQVPEIDQEIISLKFQGYTFEQIADILDMLSATIRSRYSRAMNKLRQIDSQTVDAVLSQVTTD